MKIGGRILGLGLGLGNGEDEPWAAVVHDAQGGSAGAELTTRSGVGSGDGGRSFAVGVPLMRPVVGLIERPAGRLVALQP